MNKFSVEFIFEFSPIFILIPNNCLNKQVSNHMVPATRKINPSLRHVDNLLMGRFYSAFFSVNSFSFNSS